MKITTKNPTNTTALWNIDSGELFRPINSQVVYMKLWNELCDDCWNECESRLYVLYEDLQDQDVNDITNEARACVDIATGEIVFFHKELRVVKLKYTLEVED